jgi:nucleotide-binding universal stress UspA family protein
MGRTNKILIAVDDSEASRKAVTYVSKMVRGREPIHIYLFHVLPPIPPKLLEFGGAEDPQKEQLLSTDLNTAQAQWMEKAKTAAQLSLNTAQTILRDHGMSQHNISTRLSSSIHKPDVVREVLEAAKQWDCGTVVVGRKTLPWLQELFHRHIGEELVQKGQGFSVWVVE